MKKAIAIVIALILAMTACASAEDIDLSGMSFDELLALQNQILAAMWASDEWQEVTVPVGVYVVGEDIPAGKWTIKAMPKTRSRVVHGTSLLSGGDVSSWYGADAYIEGTEYWGYSEGEATEINWVLEEGEYFQVHDAAVIFTPFVGSKLGFK